MNLAILGMVVAMSIPFGFMTYVVLQLMVMGVAGSAGVWLFYVQHQFEGVYWERGENWDYTAAALRGSSFYKLPRILQWFSGNIGFHHIHHLSPRIPNYNLKKCHDSDPMFRDVKPVTLISSLKSFTIHLWDEPRRKLVGFRHLGYLRRQRKRSSTIKPPEEAASYEKQGKPEESPARAERADVGETASPIGRRLPEETREFQPESAAPNPVVGPGNGPSRRT